MARLTHDDVERLLREPSADVRAETATKVIVAFNKRDLRPSERLIAEEIFRAMLRDAESKVRRALSENLKDNPLVPRDIAVALANDAAEIAVPMLHHSLVFTDDDLIEIVRTRPVSHQLAIAGRNAVSAAVSDALVDGGNEEVVAVLVRNEGAEIAERTYGKVIDFFSGSEIVMTGLVERPSLPPKFAERLITLVGENLRLHLAGSGKLSPEIAEDIILQSREQATMEALPADPHDVEVADLIRQLHNKGRLTPSLILRAVCKGDFRFFETAMAEITGIGQANARALIDDEGGHGMASLCAAAGLPEAVHDILRAAVEVAREMGYIGGAERRDSYRWRLIKRLEGRFRGLNPDNLETVLVRFVRVTGSHDADACRSRAAAKA
ncbi:MAG: DUF2336 domain-containing protein [Alphaproteobacteria bacterium]